MNRYTATLIGLASVAYYTAVTAQPTQASRPIESNALAYFEKQIRPVLVAHCYECHSADAEELKGGLALDTREGIRRGGDSGPAVVPGDVRSSLLMTAIRHQDGYDMPPEGKLSNEQIEAFSLWIEAGALDPRDGDTARVRPSMDIEQGRQFWAFQQPVKPDPPAFPENNWPRTDIDQFILSAQRQRGIQAVGDADPFTLVRRLYLDLIGLPPTPEEVNDFVSNWRQDSEQTLEEVVDQLLDSPRFGERWGRHWLDVARYAESSGQETNFNYPQAWRYRDYVIDAFNADLPFNQFIREQIAGDLMRTRDESQRARQMIATGFLALGPKSHIEQNRRQFELDLIDEQIDVVSQAFLGLTIACARCHDHKFDPIPQTDYYALAGIFRSTETLYGTIPVVQNRNPSRLLPLPKEADVPDGVRGMSSREIEQLERRVATLREQRTALLRDRDTGGGQFIGTIIQLATLESRLNSYETDGSPKRQAMGVRDRFRSRNSPLYVRGELDKPGDIVPRGFVRVLSDSNSPRIRFGSGRRELAEWIASPNNSLTARVIVNRVWLHLFGRGIVPTPDNFGVSGQPPSHPELLDYLAVTFMEDGWSIKNLIRRLTRSRVYLLDGTFVEANFDLDPDNVFLWRTAPRRLDAEVIRDSMLAIAGRLELEPPSGSVVANAGEGFTAGLERGRGLAEQRFQNRAVYLPVIRGAGFESLNEFDGVDGSFMVGQRPETTVPSQSLYLLNSPFVFGLASSAAWRLMELSDEPTERVELAYQYCFGRSATDEEVNAALDFLDQYRRRMRWGRRPAGGPELATWTTFCQSLWATGEFLTRK